MRSSLQASQASAAQRTPVPPQVLCYGHDPMLLYTRREILRRLGWTVEMAFNPDDYRSCVLKRSSGVIVCCQTLTPEQVLEAIVFAERCCSSSRFLVMFARVPPIAELWGCLLLPVQDGPRAFERAVFHLLQASFEDLSC